MKPGALGLEPLEPRVLLSADLAGAQPVLADAAAPADNAIYVDLNAQASQTQQESLSVLTFDALSGDQASQPQTESVALSMRPLEQARQQAVELFGVSPALFVENQGQWSDPSVRYVHDGKGFDVAMTDAGVSFRGTDASPQGLQFSASFVGANLVRPTGQERSTTVFNYCVGDPATWRQSVPSYETVTYEGLYEGADLYVQGLVSHLKYEFHVTPGADYRQIAVHYEGIEGLSIGGDGSLDVNLGAGQGVIRDDAPYIYQEIDGRHVQVAGRFILLDNQTYSFEVTGPVDPDHALVIDPNLIWSTYLGGSADDSGSSIAMDSSGNVYAAGYTKSSGWTSGGFDTSYHSANDAFVAKFSPSGGHLWSTYLGASGEDSADGIALVAHHI